MIKSEEKEDKKTILNDKDKAEKNGQQENIEEPVKEESLEEKLKNTQEKLLRSMAEMENQRRRSEKEKESIGWSSVSV